MIDTAGEGELFSSPSHSSLAQIKARLSILVCVSLIAGPYNRPLLLSARTGRRLLRRSLRRSKERFAAALCDESDGEGQPGPNVESVGDVRSDRIGRKRLI